MSERIGFDVAACERRVREGPCFVCLLAQGDTEYRRANVMIYEDPEVLIFLNRYPTLRGYTLVCPRRHVERVVGDFTEAEYLQLQSWVYRVGRAIEEVVETERVYVLSLGSQQGTRMCTGTLHHSRPGVPYHEQQLAALAMSRGIIRMSPEEAADLAAHIRRTLLSAVYGMSKCCLLSFAWVVLTARWPRAS